MDALAAVTWNLGGLNDREGELDVRTEAQCFALLMPEPRPHVLMLQELVHRSWHAHWKHHLKAAGYRVLPPDPTTDSEYFSLLAVQAELAVAEHGVTPFPGSHMGRALVWAVVEGWWVGTAHLESGRAAAGERVRQLDQALSLVQSFPGPAVFAGDTNLRVGEEPRVSLLSQVTDAWKAAGEPAGLKHTWQGPGSYRGTPRARFDRIFFNERAAVRELVAVDGRRLSDHLGLKVVLGRLG